MSSSDALFSHRDKHNRNGTTLKEVVGEEDEKNSICTNAAMTANDGGGDSCVVPCSGGCSTGDRFVSGTIAKKKNLLVPLLSFALAASILLFCFAPGCRVAADVRRNNSDAVVVSSFSASEGSTDDPPNAKNATITTAAIRRRRRLLRLGNNNNNNDDRRGRRKATEFGQLDVVRINSTTGEEQPVEEEEEEETVPTVPPEAEAVNAPVTAVDVRVFCFGDSLTAGVSPDAKVPANFTATRPGGIEKKVFPYAEYLESALKGMMEAEEEEKEGSRKPRYLYEYTVRYAGYPGWMSNEMFELVCRGDDECGKRGVNNFYTPASWIPISEYSNSTARDEILGLSEPETTVTTADGETITKKTIGVLIFQGGSNDLARIRRTPGRVSRSIAAVHELAVNQTAENSVVRTIAIGIPSSRFQEGSSAAREKALTINRRLGKWVRTENSEQRRHHDTAGKGPAHYYQEFPFEFRDRNKDGSDDNDPQALLWSNDGRHMSPEGYSLLGESLAQRVKDIIEIEFE